jgi:hypothetical protein
MQHAQRTYTDHGKISASRTNMFVAPRHHAAHAKRGTDESPARTSPIAQEKVYRAIPSHPQETGSRTLRTPNPQMR